MTAIRVLNVVTRLSLSGGIPTVVRKIISQSSNQIDHYVCQIRPIDAAELQDPILANGHLLSLDLRGSWTRSPSAIPAAGRLVRIIHTVKPDIVHVHTGSSLISAPAKMTPGLTIPWLIDLHEPLGARHSRMTERLVAHMSKKRAWCVTHSTPVRDEILRTMRINPERLFLIPLGINIASFETAETGRTTWRSRAGYGPGDVLVITVGRVSEMKGVKTLLSVAERFRSRPDLPRVVFVIAGSSESPDLFEKEVRSRGLGDIVAPVGFVKDLPSALNAADIYFTPSSYEGFGLSVVEAMAAGLPVVASNVGGLSYVVDDGETGFLVKSTDIDGFADRLESLVRTPSLRERLGATGYERARRRFNEDTMVAAYEDLYRIITEQSAQGT